MTLLDMPPRQLFFTGKGGVGKTSIACATAVTLADRGRRVLLVSTDPASNLDEVLGVQLGTSPTPIPSVAGLSALNLDPEAAARAYRERVVGPYRALLPAAAITSMEEQLSGACTVEIAAFDEFARLLGDPAATTDFDHVIFDTAPTGHTLRLLSLPQAWSDFVEENTTGTSCLGPLSGLKSQKALYDATISALSDATRTLLVLVTRPEGSALREAARTRDELSALGVDNQHLIVNAVFRPALSDGGAPDSIAEAMGRRAREALAAMPAALVGLPRSEIALSPHGLVGTWALRGLLDGDQTLPSLPSGTPQPSPASPSPTVGLGALVDEIERGGRGVVMTMGKGGVGKTTVASAVAVELARRGHAVHLTTTDPAAHVAGVVAAPPPGLTVSRISPVDETRRYIEEVIDTAGRGLDDKGRALLEEDLRSPCTEEVAVFRAFARVVAEGARDVVATDGAPALHGDAARGGFVVLDTAPTGHTLLLLDAAEAYHREVLRQGSHMPESVKRLIPRLRDPAYTKVLIVTLAEATPVHEAARLQEDLRRAGIEPFAWVINQSLRPCTTRHPVLLARREEELPYIDEVTRTLASRVALVPWLPEPPVGAAALGGLIGEPRAAVVTAPLVAPTS